MTDAAHSATPASPFDRVLRGSAFVAIGYGASQAMRLAANLILTRLLFPEAFGLMALVSVFLVGLAMFSDVGIGPAIMQHKRGDDPVFLNTAWTIQIVRGVLLWLVTLVLAVPLARFYEAPMLAHLLPAAGLSLLIAGFNPTRIESAGRHLLLGRLTVLDLASQVIGTLSMIGLAFLTGSIWALVIGALIGALAKLWLTHRYLAGLRNRLVWDRATAHEMMRFGKWIFLSTVCGFVLAQGDKAILGRFLSLADLGIYNIGYFLAGFPIFMGAAVNGKVMIPLYRTHRETGGALSERRLRRLRAGMTLAILAILGAVALLGMPLVALLYDPRYAAAGVVVVAMACVHMPTAIGLTYDQSALAAGDSRRFFYLLAVRAALQTGFFLVGVSIGGLTGAIVGSMVSHLLAYPFVVVLARRHRVWDPRHDAVFWVLALVLVGLAAWVNWDHADLLLRFGQA